MAYFIPSYIQKRLLRYALSQFPVVDTETLDLDQLDIAWGKRSSVELRDVGLHVKKLAVLCQLPDSLQPTEARIRSVRLTVPADIYNSGIEVDVQGIDVVCSLDRRKSSGSTSATPRNADAGRRTGAQDSGSDEEQDHIPTAEELAESFLHDEPAVERRELEDALQSAGVLAEEASDSTSETSDEDNMGTGVALAVPAFLANFLKGIIDRLSVALKNVKFSLTTHIPTENGSQSPVTLSFVVSSLEIEGFTSASTVGPGVEEPRQTPEKRSIRMLGISGELITETALLANLEKLLTASSRFPGSNATSSPRQHDSQSQLDTSRLSHAASHSSRQPRSSALGTWKEPQAGSRTPPAYSSSQPVPNDHHDHAGASDYGEDFAAAANEDQMDDSVHDPRKYQASTILSSQILPSELEDELESEELPFMMDDAAYPYPYDYNSRELDPYTLMGESLGPQHSAPPVSRRSLAQLSATAPTIPLSTEDSLDFGQRLPISSSQPTQRTGKDRMVQSTSLFHEESPRPSPSPPKSDSSGSPSETAEASLAQSMLYSHEEARSMYMSAIGESQSEYYGMPGGWSASTSSEGSNDRRETPIIPGVQDRASAIVEAESSGAETPRPGTPSNVSSSPESKFQEALEGDDGIVPQEPRSHVGTLSKRLFEVNEIVLHLPWAVASDGPATAVAGDAPVGLGTHQSSTTKNMPGAFSQYQSVFSERFKDGGNSSMHTRIREATELTESTMSLAVDPESLPVPSDPDLSAQVGTIQLLIDPLSARLVFRMFEQLVEVWSRPGAALGDKRAEATANAKATSPLPAFLLTLEHIAFSFMEDIPAINSQAGVSPSRASSLLAEALFAINVQGMDISNLSVGDAFQLKLNLQSFKAGYPDESILSFDRASKRQSLSRSKLLNKEPDVRLTFKSSTIRGPELDIVTLPVVLVLDLQKLDDRLVMFGGVSGILDLSSSVASNSTILGPSPPRRRPGNVRFDGDVNSTETPTLSPVKINARLYGASLSLQGKSCTVMANTGTLAIVVRQDTARVKIEHTQVRAPLMSDDPTSSAFTLDVFKTDIVFLVSGVEEDFERLVALIHPSNDRYETDDDVLLDMLRRQRKNGSVLRIAIADVQGNVANLDHLDSLQQLAAQLGRLSSGVTKYLPEDDRPGILVLPRIETMRLQAAINESLGTLVVSLEKLDMAHVGTPLLLGFRIGAVNAARNGDSLVASLLAFNTDVTTPELMGRFIGNVPDPRMKLKLFNVLAEYKIPTIMALMGVSEVETVEDLAMSMAASIATLKKEPSFTRSDVDSPVPSARPKPAKPQPGLDVYIRDCALGLNPTKSQAKALVLISKAQLRVDELADSGPQIGFGLTRGTMLLIDDIDVLDFDITPAARHYDSENFSPAIDDLARQGFQPVLSLWSTDVKVSITTDELARTLVDVGLANRLLTLETCSDSQQSLGALLGNLAPPLPKKKAQLYRTRVVPIEDMMRSFVGEPFVQSDAAINDDRADEGLDMETADHILEDLPSNMDFVGSFYDPEDETGNNNPSVLGSVNRLASRILLPAKNDSISFAIAIEERFEYGADNVLIDTSENYLAPFRSKAPCRRWNSKNARLDPIYSSEAKRCKVKVSAKFDQVTWNLHDGYDWVATRDQIAQKVEQVEAKIEQRRRARRNSAREGTTEDEIEDMLFQSIWIQVPADADERDLRRNINKQIADDYTETDSTHTESVDTRTTGTRPVHRRKKSTTLHLERSRKKISFDLRNTVADFLLFSDGDEETQDSLALRVGDFEIYDHVPSSTWKKFLTYLHGAGERQMGKPMIRLDAITVKPVADLAATELILKASLLPLRLHVDQDALDFITRFFEFKDPRIPPSSGEPGPFIARLEVDSIPVALDYKPKKVDYAGLRSGSTSEFANFVILERAEFILKRLIMYGMKSPDELQPRLKGIWTDDVIKNQLPTVLAGLSGVRPLVDVGGGIRDLVVVPMREYRKDGRVVRSIQKGAVAFAKTTTSELARLGAKVAIGTQTVLEGAEGLLSPTSDKRRQSRPIDEWGVDDFSTSPAREEPRAVSNYADQPLNVVTGLRTAWQGLERDLVTAKDAIIAIGGEARDSGSAFGAVGALARLAPTVILRPAIGATRGLGMTLLGAGNMLDKDSKRKIEDKYKRY